MMHHHQTAGGAAGLLTPMRNAYFHGQLLGVQQFELETSYAIQQRRLLNRLVLGHGVVCGLGVEVSRDGTHVRIAPGLAIDGWGREIVIAHRTGWIEIPPDVIEEARRRGEGSKRDPCIQVLLCYHECRGDPAPVYAGDCSSPNPCAPSTVREQYRVEFLPYCKRRPEPSCDVANVFAGGGFDYEQLARWVTYERRCTELPDDPCIPLANLPLVEDGGKHHCHPDEVDISVRPILPSNGVLMELVLALLDRGRRQSDYSRNA